MPEGMSPRSATMWRMSCALYFAITSRRLSRVEATHERCGAAWCPLPRISSTVESVPSRVEPPAPKVTEKNPGFSCASCFVVARSFSTPSGVLGGKNSKLKTRGCPRWDSTCSPCSVPVGIRFVGAALAHADVLRLLRRELGQHRVQRLQLQPRDLLVEMLGQHVHAERVLVLVREELDLRDHLVGERRAHHVGRVAGAATQVHQAAIG